MWSCFVTGTCASLDCEQFGFFIACCYLYKQIKRNWMLCHAESMMAQLISCKA